MQLWVQGTGFLWCTVGECDTQDGSRPRTARNHHSPQGREAVAGAAAASVASQPVRSLPGQQLLGGIQNYLWTNVKKKTRKKDESGGVLCLWHVLINHLIRYF